jgi:thiamine-phosphate pyrophosphorylase
MNRHQTVPERWLIADARMGEDLWHAIRRLPRGSGVLLLRELTRTEHRRLRQLGGLRCLRVVTEPCATRVHNMRELRQSLLKRVPLILISPIHKTQSHPDWPPLSRMRAATLARLTDRRAIALGGMNQQRYAKIAALGFIGWAGIDAFRT